VVDPPEWLPEQIVGRDLVALQLAVAAGQPLPFTQEEGTLTGHAIEVRLNAEDPAGGRFLSAPGTITRFYRPDGYGVRTDSGYDEGDSVSQFYDNLIAKLICWGADRETARRRTLRALDELVIEGVATTVPADKAILGRPDFVAIRHSTNWVEQRLDLSGVSSAPSAPAGEDGEAPVRRDVDVEVDGRRFAVRLWVPESAPAANPTPRTSRTRAAGGGSSHAGAAGSSNVAVPMQGTVVKVLVVAVGDTVEAGQPVCVLEAMKMENNIVAEASGTVAEVRVAPGDAVGAGDVVVVIA